MDYREREYYLINIRSDYLNKKLQLMKCIAPSLKIFTPEKHFKDGLNWDYGNVANKWYDGTSIHSTDITHLVSVRKEHCYMFRIFLELATKANEIYFIKVNKKVLGQ